MIELQTLNPKMITNDRTLNPKIIINDVIET
jgi:hypothetical protein